MKLTFKYKLERLSNTKKEILKELMWHTTKVYNMVLYEIREGQVVIDENKSLNLASNPIYNYERKNNWHSKYLHSHTLQEVVINVVENYKSYKALEKKYNENPESLKGKPRFPHFKSKPIQAVLITKYAIRRKGQKLMLSLSKEMQAKFNRKHKTDMNNNKKYGVYNGNNKVLGVIATKDTTHIALFFVDGEYHKQGIGRKLYNKVESLNNKGFFTVNSSPYAHEVYKHLGFIDTDTKQCVNGLIFFPMKKNIGK